MAKDITELYSQQNSQIIVGQSMIGKQQMTIPELVKQHEESRREEEKALEAGGYDYDGSEAWAEMMSRLGRR